MAYLRDLGQVRSSETKSGNRVTRKMSEVAVTRRAAPFLVSILNTPHRLQTPEPLWVYRSHVFPLLLQKATAEHHRSWRYTLLALSNTR